MEKKELLEIIYRAVEEYNEMQEKEDQLLYEPNQRLHVISDEGNGISDTAELLNLLMILDDIFDEEQETVGIHFDIHEALENKEKHLKDINTLAEYILSKNKNQQ